MLSKLDPASIGGNKSVVTSSDLLRYINSQYPGKFVTGAAFNHYNDLDFESRKLRSKIEAGAAFIVTQPVIGKDPQLETPMQSGPPVVVEAWMSTNMDLLYKSVGKQATGVESYDPVENLRRLHEAYPTNCIYLSMLSFKQSWEEMLPRLA